MQSARKKLVNNTGIPQHQIEAVARCVPCNLTASRAKKFLSSAGTTHYEVSIIILMFLHDDGIKSHAVQTGQDCIDRTWFNMDSPAFDSIYQRPDFPRRKWELLSMQHILILGKDFIDKQRGNSAVGSFVKYLRRDRVLAKQRRNGISAKSSK